MRSNVDCFVRITTDNDVCMYASIFKGYKSLIAQEYKDNSTQSGKHYHALVLDVRKATLESRLKKFFKGNQQYSCVIAKDNSEVIRYICKGTVDTKPVIVQNDLDVDIDLSYSEYWRINKSLGSKKERKSKRDSFIDKVTERYEKIREDPDNISLYQIFECIFQQCKDDDKLIPGDQLCIQYAETIAFRLNGSLEYKKHRMYEKMQMRQDNWSIMNYR